MMEYQVLIVGFVLSAISTIASFFIKSYFKRLHTDIDRLALVVDRRIDEIREIRTLVHIISADVKTIAEEILVHKKKIHELSGYLNGDTLD